MVLLSVIVLGTMLVLGCFALWRAQMLFRRKEADYLKSNYGVVDPAKVGSASLLLGLVFFVWGIWLISAPVFVFTFSIPFNSWGGLIALGLGIKYLGDSMVRRKFGERGS